MRKTIGLLCGLALLPSLGVCEPAIKEVLTPAGYFKCQIAAQQASIQGIEERVQLLSDVNATDAEKRAVGELSRQRVTMVMYACGRQNASTLGAYAHRNANALQTWLNANPAVKTRLAAQRQRIADLSSQMSAAPPASKR